MSDEGKSPMGILFLVVLVDMIGFTIVIPVSYTHLTLPTSDLV